MRCVPRESVSHSAPHASMANVSVTAAGNWWDLGPKYLQYVHLVRDKQDISHSSMKTLYTNSKFKTAK